MDKTPTVAIILPVANERDLIRETLEHLLSLGADEVIAVDGSSEDGTFETIQSAFPGVRCVRSAERNRALQMNLGGHEAVSDILLFVHADMRLPLRAVRLIQAEIRNGSVGGGFLKSYTPSSPLLALYAFSVNTLYSSLTRSFVGTNAIFATGELFRKLGGFPPARFMEDVVFSEKLRKQGRVSMIADPVRVSSRRYLKQGVLRQILRNAEILLRYRFLRQNPSRLRELYEA